MELTALVVCAFTVGYVTRDTTITSRAKEYSVLLRLEEKYPALDITADPVISSGFSAK